MIYRIVIFDTATHNVNTVTGPSDTAENFASEVLTDLLPDHSDLRVTREGEDCHGTFDLAGRSYAFYVK